MSNENNELEQEFEKVVNSVKNEIEGKLAHAQKYIREAVRLSEEHGVPFSTGVSEIGNTYTPRSFTKSKFATLDCEFVDSVTGVYETEYCGWQHSAVC